MPKPDVEIKAIKIAKQIARKKFKSEPKEMPEGCGYNLECGTAKIEVKGSKNKNVGFVFCTLREGKVAAADDDFELWVFTDVLSNPRFHRIPAVRFRELQRSLTIIEVKLGKKRLSRFIDEHQIVGEIEELP